MRDIVALLEQHGYAVLALIVFLEAVGVPVPAALALIAAGAASAGHHLRPEMVLVVALSAMLLGDTLLFILGRQTGWALLSFLCRIALNPESCILRSAESFYRRGRTTLLFAKFIPGINSLAPPLAGSMRMGYRPIPAPGLRRRLLLHARLRWVRLSVQRRDRGRRQRGADRRARGGMAAVRRALGYVAYRVYLYWRHRKYRVVPRVQVQELASRLSSGEAGGMTVADVRSHGYYDPGATRIKGSIRLEPNNLLATVKDWPHDQQIYLYCT